MIDPVSVLSEGFVEASKQYTAYIAIGLSAALSALVLDQRLAPGYEAAFRTLKREPQPGDDELLGKLSDSIKVSGASVDVPVGTARWILIGLSFVAGLLAYNAAASMSDIAKKLATNAELLAALWLHPGIATGHAIVRYGAVALAAFFIAIVAWRDGRRVQKLSPDERLAPFMMAGVAAIPYIAVVFELRRLADACISKMSP